MVNSAAKLFGRLSLLGILGFCFLNDSAAVPASRQRIIADKANVVAITPTEMRYVRIFITESENGQPCIDELELYGADDKLNLAAASKGGKATASSCLPGYAIHKVANLNDGRYGNSRSWIAANTSGDWAQIELASPATVHKVIISRDREGRFRDRIPSGFEVQVSMDGQNWRTVRSVGMGMALPQTKDWDAFLRYAFLSEQDTWSRIDRDDGTIRVFKQMEAMLGRLARKGVDVSGEATKLAMLKKRLGEMNSVNGAPDQEEELYLQARLAKRQLFFRDPDLSPLQRILFVARHPYEPSHNYSDILDANWRPGGGIRVLNIPLQHGRLEPAAGAVSKLFEAGTGVARDPMAGFDGEQIYFAFRPAPHGYFHVYKMNTNGGGLKQLTDGPFHDYYPCPLPDTGLAFISTRCKARFLCWRPQAFVLFRMDADGENIRPLSYANLSEWGPSVMNDGRIIWTRSEYLDKGADFGHTLWAIHPDGTHPELIFGNNTLNCYMSAREVPGTTELCCTLISHGGDLNGPIALIDIQQGRSNPKAITNITPDVPPRYHMDWAQRECFRDPVPVARDYFLVSHAPQKHFGLYVIDRYGNRELLYLDPQISSMSPTLLRKVPTPPVLPDMRPQTNNPATGHFMLSDIYKGLEPTVKRGTVKYLRVCQEVRADLEQLPNGEYRNDHPPFEDFYASPTHLVRGPYGWPSFVAKTSLGIVAVNPDGSASFEAPAGKVIYFQALDENLNELQRMRSVIQLQPGEQRGCVGCHEHRATAGLGRLAARVGQPPQKLEPPSWGAVPFAYEQVVQPVWNAKCVSCHNDNHPRKLNLTGTLAPDRVPISYRELITKGWVHHFDYTWGQEHTKAEALTFGTLQSKLWKVLGTNHHEVKLTRDEMHRVKCWIDLNCPLWPDYIQRELRPAKQQTAKAR